MTEQKPALEAYGTWTVTTEGDCEGRSTRNLGTHTGYLDDIAFALADQAYYGLEFEPVHPDKLLKKRVAVGSKSIQVKLGVSSGTWDLTGPERVSYFKRMLGARATIVLPGTYFASVKLATEISPEAQAEAKKNLALQSARLKLTPAELKILGLE